MSSSRIDDQTPKTLANKIVRSIKWAKGEKVLEPCRGDGAFYDALPSNVHKEWCEIRQGKDFFDFQGKVDHRHHESPLPGRGRQAQNLVMPFFQKGFEVARKRVIFLFGTTSASTV